METSQLNYFESHAHLHYLKDLDLVLERARNVGVSPIITISVDEVSLDQNDQISSAHEDIYMSCGVHPHESKTWTPALKAKIKNQLGKKKSVAVGETGLDYFYDLSLPETQKEVFREHCQLAKEFQKPMVIHCREASEDLHKILKEEGPFPRTGVIHCFTESLEFSKKILDLGFFIGFTGIITFKNADPLRKVVEATPLERILIETDSPYLAPVPLRGKTNEPSFVVHVAQKIAEIKQISVEEVVRATKKNGEKVFGIKS